LAYGEFETGKITLLNLDIDDLLKKIVTTYAIIFKIIPVLVQKINIYVTIY